VDYAALMRRGERVVIRFEGPDSQEQQHAQ
jgi:hypothetical protein